MKYKKWSVDKIYKTDDGRVASLTLVGKDEDKEVYIKWDGCVDILKYDNGFTTNDEYSEEKENNTDYIHICDLEDFIKELQEALDIAKDIIGEIFEG